MRKSKIIAKCLRNSDMVSSIEDGESIVMQVFLDEFPRRDFDEWNTELENEDARQIIKNVGRATQIRVDLFIKDLNPL